MELKMAATKFNRKSNTSSSKGLCYAKSNTKWKNMNSSVTRRAEELRFKLGTKYPSFTKYLMRSHVASCFWMGLPLSFCKMYLPQQDTYFTLLTQNGKKYTAKYLARKTALSAGWRGFSLAEKLSEGDALVFQLIQPTKLKVYIIRKSDLTEKEESRVKSKLQTERIQCATGRNVAQDKDQELAVAQDKDQELAVAQDKDQEVSFIRADSADEFTLPAHLNSVKHVKSSFSNTPNNDQLIIYRRGGVHQIAEKENYNPTSLRLKARNTGGSMLLHKEVEFSNITSFEEFKAAIHDLLQNHELPYYVLHDYYELCCSQNAFLHAHLFEGINPKLNCQNIIEAMKKIILTTVSLANALRSCNLSTFLHNYAMWNQTLNTYGTLGMNVSFLLARLHHLKGFAVKAEAKRSQYKEACHERRFAESEVKKLEVLLSELQELNNKTVKFKPQVCAVKAEIKNLEVLLAEFGKFFCHYDAHISALKLEAKNLELKLKDEASSPWSHS